MTIESVRPIYRGRVITLNVESVRLPNDHVTELEIIHHPGGAAIVAVDARRRVCLLRQYRHAAGGWLGELPAGKLEPDEPPLETAKRELIEEAGASAARWRSLGVYVSSPGVLTERIHLFLAEGLDSVKTAHEKSELIEIYWVEFEEACQRALTGDIDDGKSVIGLLRARELLHRSASDP